MHYFNVITEVLAKLGPMILAPTFATAVTQWLWRSAAYHYRPNNAAALVAKINPYFNSASRSTSVKSQSINQSALTLPLLHLDIMFHLFVLL